MNIIVSRVKKYGGIATFLYNYLKNAEIEEQDILILSADIDQKILSDIKKVCAGNIVFFPSIPEKYPNIIRRIIEARFIRQITLNHHVEKIVILEWNLLLDWYAHIKNIHYVVFVHVYPTRKLPSLASIFTNMLIKNTTIVTVSNYSAEQISKAWNVKKEDVKVLYNYSSLEGNDRNLATLTGDKHVVTIAHCRTYKNPELWLEIAELVTKERKDIHFNWYGDGEMFEHYSNLTLDNKNIHFHGYRNDISNILQNQTNIYLQCSSIESLGISILDAMNYSKPILVSNIGGMPELVNHSENGFICQDKVEFSKQIIKIFDDEVLYNYLSFNSKKKYEVEFSEKYWLKKIKSI